MKFDPRMAVLAAESSLSAIAADPIAAFRFSGYGQRNFVEAFHKFDEVGLQAANQAGKTTIGGIFHVAMMRGVKELCGDIVGVNGVVQRHDPIELPLLGTPVSFLSLAQGREMAKDSVVKAMTLAVGDHPHHWERNANSMAALWVKPDNSRSDNWHDWSVMRFFVEDGQSVAGMRLDGVWADEPPKWSVWQELRMRGKANKPFLRCITFTPTDINRWRPIRDDFVGCQWPKGKDGKVVVRMSVYDNKRLSNEHLKSVERAAKGPLMKAKLYGDFVNAAGSNPFDADGLKLWESRCVPGREVNGLSPSGRPYKYEVWEDRRDGEGYFVVADPSAGIEDEQHEHDPSGIVVITRTPPYTVVARYNGYLSSRDLGWLGAKLATEYNRAMLAWEHNSGYGESFWEGTAVNGRHYGNPYVEFHGDRRKLALSERIGWLTTATTRGTIIGALQKAIDQDGLRLYSLEAVESLGSVVLKRDGLRAEAGAGAHDEDMIILGLGCHLLETIPFYAPPREKGSERLARELGLRFRAEAGESDPFRAV